jgi:hypothetical protein
MARSYKRDANGRFAGGGGGSGGGGKRPAAKAVSRGANRLTRDNAGKITSVGGNGATARGGRLKTASGKQRATQTARAIGGSRAGTIKGRVTRNPTAGAKLAAAGRIKSSGKGSAPVAKTSKAPVNPAKQRYKDAKAMRYGKDDLRGADADVKRKANSAAAKVRLMERNRSTKLPKAPSDSPRTRQRIREIDRSKRASANYTEAMKKESDGPGSKASRSASVAKRAKDIYNGKIDPKVKTKSRLTRTRDPEQLRKRMAKMRDNTLTKPARSRSK